MSSLTISPINHSPIFKSTRLVNVEKHSDYEARTYETDASTGKKWGVGLASFFIPGLGQGINGQWEKQQGSFLEIL